MDSNLARYLGLQQDDLCVEEDEDRNRRLRLLQQIIGDDTRGGGGTAGGSGGVMETPRADELLGKARMSGWGHGWVVIALVVGGFVALSGCVSVCSGMPEILGWRACLPVHCVIFFFESLTSSSPTQSSSQFSLLRFERTAAAG